jgi:hypothetical protein
MPLIILMSFSSPASLWLFSGLSSSSLMVLLEPNLELLDLIDLIDFTSLFVFVIRILLEPIVKDSTHEARPRVSPSSPELSLT